MGDDDSRRRRQLFAIAGGVAWGRIRSRSFTGGFNYLSEVDIPDSSSPIDCRIDRSIDIAGRIADAARFAIGTRRSRGSAQLAGSLMVDYGEIGTPGVP